jgi:phosphoribosylformylglycinamidine (FGAM) synthase-like enzyme
MVGLLEDVNDKMTLNFKNEGDVIYLIGQSRNDFNSSEYLHKIIGEEFSPCPYFDLQEEFEMQQTVAGLIKNKLVQSAHDVSEGGLFVTLMESCFNNDLGFAASANETFRKDAYWFGEAQSRVVVSVKSTDENNLITALKKSTTAFSRLGNVTAGNININDENWGNISEWKDKYDNAIGNLLLGQEG